MTRNPSFKKSARSAEDHLLERLAVAPAAVKGAAARTAAATLEASGLIEPATEGEWRVTPPGMARLARIGAGDDGYLAQHATLGRRRVEVDGVQANVVVDLDESPLAWLARRKGKDGQPMLAPHEVLAGERLRADFTRAGMTPRVTANWSAPVAASRGGGAGGAGAVGDVALDARRRVERAVAAVGPELSGALLDVCCFLKGLEEVERERGWPARGGKLVLGLALTRLARHYGYGDAAEGPERSRIVAWSAPQPSPL